MSYLIVAAFFLIVVVVFTYHSIAAREKRKLEDIKSAWGKPKRQEFYFGSIERYAGLARENDFHRLTPQTLDDIDFESLFAFVDRTTSRVGQQFLYKKIVQPSNNSSDELKSLIDLFGNDEELRLNVQRELSKLSHADAYSICSLLRGKLIAPPKWFRFLKFDVALVILLLVISVKLPFALILLFAPFTINIVVHYWNKNNTILFIKSFPQLRVLANVASNIADKNALLRNPEVQTSIQQLKPFQRKASLLTLSGDGGIQSELSNVGLYFYELLKAFFLVEIFSLFAAVKELESKQSAIDMLFSFVGKIDSAISIASLRAGKLKTCIPEFVSERKELVVKNIYHPLVANCVKNDLLIERSILITGSNMSGKSTFLRVIALNSILAQSIHTCFADEFKSPMLKQFSSIHIADDLLEGKSYYMKEVETVSSLVQEAEMHSQNIFFLDEVFKGTNTVERISAGKAVLSFLNRRNNIVIVSTHDIELAELLKNEFDLYHFTETIEDKQLYFDHRIKQGRLKSTNAIRILEISDFPSDIIAEAKNLCIAIRRSI